MDKWVRQMEKVDDYVKRALELAKWSEDTRENREKFSKICDEVLSEKDPLIACCFAVDVSYKVKGIYEKLFNVQKFQNIVMQSDDDEIIYKFARDVKGADVRRVIDRLPNGYARRELKHDLKPIDEERTF